MAKKPTPSGSALKSTEIDQFLATLSADKRSALAKLRKDIRAAAPNLEECISYGLPAFRLNGKFLLAFGAGANHCAFYPGTTVQSLEADLTGYDTSKGTIRFPADTPLPAALVRKIVKARIAAKAPAKPRPTRAKTNRAKAGPKRAQASAS
ncbi:MAG: DUF1801 domain-containing protein [Opitutae bacterium]|nr:DUF1801 domain-containing protein [Opitutae bacterium]